MNQLANQEETFTLREKVIEQKNLINTLQHENLTFKAKIESFTEKYSQNEQKLKIIGQKNVANRAEISH